MLDLLLAVVCSVAVALLFKWAPRRDLDLGQLLLWNYLAAALLAGGMLHPQQPEHAIGWLAWTLALGFGLLLPGGLFAMARAVQRAGLARADAAQRLSLVPALLAAFTLFGEQPDALRLLGLGLGLAAIAALAVKPGPQAGSGAAGWLLIVCAAYAATDVLLKWLSLHGASIAAVLRVAFALAFAVMALVQAWRHHQGNRLNWRSCVAGLSLGTINFTNVIVYIGAHQALREHPSLVFAGVNLGVVVLSALLGLTLLGERAGAMNRVGIALAGAAIVVLAWSVR